MKFVFSVLLLLVAISSPIQAFAEDNKLPSEAADVLHASSKIILYSLEPWSLATTNDNTLHGYKILGQVTLDGKDAATAITAFESSILKKKRHFTVLCFDPRHALRVMVNAQTYDFLLCYACGYLYVYRGDKIIATLDAGGSPNVLNALLTAAKIPLSKSGEQ
jgi:hypothetical protein